MEKGLFITFEGTDASGKSTQSGLLAASLERRGYDVILTREPGGTDIGEKIRKILLDKDNAEMSGATEVLLYAAARAQLISQIIRPGLLGEKIVICDRFLDSSVAYQGAGRNLGAGMIESVNAYAVASCMPDITFLLKIKPETGKIRRRAEDEDRIESETDLYHKTVYDAYLELERRFTERIVGIDGNAALGDISAEIERHVEKLLRRVKRDNGGE
ncbi:MAG: dTMP kinase [Clostridiales Family XIII bacterium]|jgi:dTMP kinase|nr:dTMP kinase [Clostridiales Family XIII bacterium]